MSLGFLAWQSLMFGLSMVMIFAGIALLTIPRVRDLRFKEKFARHDRIFGYGTARAWITPVAVAIVSAIVFFCVMRALS
jgi:hypothetical protein